MAIVCFALAAAMLVLLLLMAGGCGKVWMSPDYARQVELAEINVAELDRRCRAGDPNACAAGLAVSAETLSLIVEAMHGEASGGDPNGQ